MIGRCSFWDTVESNSVVEYDGAINGDSTQNWAPPVLSDGKLLIRDQMQIKCVAVKLFYLPCGFSLKDFCWLIFSLSLLQ
jgi:hypothetical protein